MIQPETPEKKKGFLGRLPKMGRTSQLVLLIGIFLILFIPLMLINNQQPAKQAALKATLFNLERILAAEETPKAKLEAELGQINAETEATEAIFPNISQSPEILDSLFELAELNDIYVTQTKVSISQPKETIGQLLTIQIGLKGQVPKFQNFLLALDDKLPTSQIKQLTFTIAVEEGEEDTASITIDILCYEGSK
jgi:low affinity Fe/Cu permease